MLRHVVAALFETGGADQVFYLDPILHREWYARERRAGVATCDRAVPARRSLACAVGSEPHDRAEGVRSTQRCAADAPRELQRTMPRLRGSCARSSAPVAQSLTELRLPSAYPYARSHRRHPCDGGRPDPRWSATRRHGTMTETAEAVAISEQPPRVRSPVPRVDAQMWADSYASGYVNIQKVPSSSTALTRICVVSCVPTAV